MIDRRTFVGAAAAAAAAPAVSAAPGPSAIRVLREDWADPARGRVLPMLLRLPSDQGPAPVVVLSHGLGGSREGLPYLGEALAAAGYAAVHVQHPGTDSSVWQGGGDPRSGMLAAAMDPGRALARLQDVAFVLDELARRNRSGPLAGRFDLSRAAIAGHSYGAWTVTHMLGERLPLPAPLTLPDPRLRAGIAMSPIPPLGLPPEAAYAPLRLPVLYVTGTADSGWGVSDWRQRTLGYQHGTGPAVLAVLDGAAHAAFAGEAVAGGYWNQPTYQGRTARLAVEFLDAALLGDAAARDALLAGTGLSRGDRIEARGLDRLPVG